MDKLTIATIMDVQTDDVKPEAVSCYSVNMPAPFVGNMNSTDCQFLHTAPLVTLTNLLFSSERITLTE